MTIIFALDVIVDEIRNLGSQFVDMMDKLLDYRTRLNPIFNFLITFFPNLNWETEIDINTILLVGLIKNEFYAETND